MNTHIKYKINWFLNALGFKIKGLYALDFPKTSYWLSHCRYFGNIYDQIAKVPGDIVECGVGGGGSFLLLAHLMSKEPHEHSRMLWGFDSSQGFPDPTSEDFAYREGKARRNPQKSDWRGFTPEGTRRKLLDTGIDNTFIEEQVRIVPGFFSESLTRFPADRLIALLHIDADLYQSYRDALQALFPKVAEGGAVLFDEYNSVKWPGVTKAVDEYFSGSHYRVQKNNISGKYYLIKRDSEKS